MNKFSSSFLFRLRSFLSPYFVQNIPKTFHYDFSGQLASDYISNRLDSREPLLISRFGSGELHATATFLRSIAISRFPFEKCFSFALGNLDTFFWHNGIRHSLSNGAGIFSVDNLSLEKFSRRMLEDASYIDLLGSWRDEEKALAPFMPHSHKIPLKDLEPYFCANPWSYSLRNRKVLVIHPFVETIIKQYRNRVYLFEDQRILPDFHLLTYKPLQTIAGNYVNHFSNWFEALSSMEMDILSLDFDVAIVGAGGYGLPLSASIKRSGRQAIHLGGATQLLFGIHGRRWDSRAEFQFLYNNYWVRPSEHETPSGAESVEGGCYW
jgi:hypothetical protein